MVYPFVLYPFEFIQDILLKTNEIHTLNITATYRCRVSIVSFLEGGFRWQFPVPILTNLEAPRRGRIEDRDRGGMCENPPSHNQMSCSEPWQ